MRERGCRSLPLEVRTNSQEQCNAPDRMKRPWRGQDNPYVGPVSPQLWLLVFYAWLSRAGRKQKACQLTPPCMLQSPPVGRVPEQGSPDVLLSLNEVLGCQEGLGSPVQRLCIAPILLKHLRSMTALTLSIWVGGHFACHHIAGEGYNARQAGVHPS